MKGELDKKETPLCPAHFIQTYRICMSLSMNFSIPAKRLTTVFKVL
jgi:hypothetical protein